MSELVPVFKPDFTSINNLLCLDGTPINEFHVVSKSGHGDLLQDMLQPMEVSYDFDESEDNPFDSIIPKEVQSQDEIYGYMNYLKTIDKD